MARGQSLTTQREVVEGMIVGNGSMVMTADEYSAYSKENGRINGRLPDQKTVMSPEEFVALYNSGWTPKMMMDKHGLTLEELQGVANKVGLIMQLLRPIQVTNTLIKF